MEAQNIIKALLKWYGRHKRDLPWRRNVTPYRVWLSEIMLQQTTVPAVIPYFLKFTEKYPTVEALAAADVNDIMQDWAGLGYYSRARNLHACAKAVNGVFPSDLKELKTLPGIGDYTAGAIRAIAFNQPASVVDGNVDRVISRLYAIETPLPASKPEIRVRAEDIYLNKANTEPSALPQAFMDLGATICTPKSPKCDTCPLVKICMAKAANLQNELPRKSKKATRPERIGWVYWIENNDGSILLERRANKGLLGGMAGLPTSAWVDGTQYPPHPEYFKNIKETEDTIKHVFTHFGLTLKIAKATIKTMPEHYFWADAPNGLPSVFAKVVKLLNTTR